MSKHAPAEFFQSSRGYFDTAMGKRQGVHFGTIPYIARQLFFLEPKLQSLRIETTPTPKTWRIITPGYAVSEETRLILQRDFTPIGHWLLYTGLV